MNPSISGNEKWGNRATTPFFSKMVMTAIAAAVLAGVGVLLAGNLPWGVLLAPLNLRVFTVVPWAITPMAVYLWIYWRFIGGAIGSPEAARWRREQLRANPLSRDVWGMALMTGLLGFGALAVFLGIMARVVALPASQPIIMPEGMPAITAFLLLVMSSVVAAVTEEAGFRGYMQGPIERRYGLAPAVLVNGTAFGLLHFPNHPDQVLTMLPYYIAVSAVYGGMTWASDSILPSLVLHSAGNVWSLTRLWVTGRPEWQIGNARPLIWDTGLDGIFIVQGLALVTLTAASWWSCLATASLKRDPTVGAAVQPKIGRTGQ
jgi:membrane protease YdiL (CAAX protease family)